MWPRIFQQEPPSSPSSLHAPYQAKEWVWTHRSVSKWGETLNLQQKSECSKIRQNIYRGLLTFPFLYRDFSNNTNYVGILKPSNIIRARENYFRKNGQHRGSRHGFVSGTSQGTIHQLDKWIYEVDKDNITLAERLERSKWEVVRLERL